jgi:hypothetical protein
MCDVKPVSHRNYLDPDLEKAINEVLSFKPIQFKRTSLEDSEAEKEKTQDEEGKEDCGYGEEEDEEEEKEDEIEEPCWVQATELAATPPQYP